MAMLCKFVVCWTVFLLPAMAIRELLVADAEAEAESYAWERKTYMICLSEAAELACDGSDQMMEVVSAYYNRNTKAGDKECGSYESDWKSCKVNAIDMVRKQCQSTNFCHLGPSDHASCEEEGKGEDTAFKQMRVVIRCKTAGKDAIKKQPFKPGDETPTAKLPIVDTNKATLPAVNVEDNLEDVAFVPCYRSLDVGDVIDGDVQSDNWRAELSSSVSACDATDGCFHLSFPDGIVYTNGEETPTPDELAKGELEETSDNMWVTYAGVGLKHVDYGIGLKRNDYGTWGICLPKTKTVQEAVALWNTIRKVGAE